MSATLLRLKDLTKEYIQRFHAKNLAGIGEMLHENFVLEDPVVKRVEGKAACLNAIQAIFDNNQELSFKARNIFEDGATTIIEFELKLGSVTLTGTDIIEWEEGRMRELRAYLDIPK
jgi:ketosteroid isomerase-like protein